MLYFLCVLGLILFGWSVYDIVRDPSFMRQRWVIFSSLIVSTLLYFASVYALLGHSWNKLPLAIQVFDFLGILLSWLVSGWLGYTLAESENRSDYLKRTYE